MLKKTKELIKTWCKKLKNAYTNMCIELSHTKLLNKCYMTETEDHYDWFKISGITRYSNEVTCRYYHCYVHT